MVTVLWFYTRDQIEVSKKYFNIKLEKRELFASLHMDTVNTDCVEGIAYVLTLNEYSRYYFIKI